MPTTHRNRRFLFLQGPHGPFFHLLARQLRAAGAGVWRVGFNAGDRVFWPERESFIPCHAPPEEWAGMVPALLTRLGITDLVLYGDTRPVHASAIAAARAAGLTIHVFEEGYIRPYWITCERGGTNGHSRLMSMSIDEIRAQIGTAAEDFGDLPARWGDLRQHIFWGAAYHFCVLAGRRRFPAFRPHRALNVAEEFALYLRRLVLLPLHRWERMLAERRIRRGGFPYHLVLLQLEHDASFRDHSSFASMTDFVRLVIDGFADGAPGHHHLVFKAHPLEDGRAPVAAEIRRQARDKGLAGRVHFVRGGKLAGLMAQAASAVTVNSTAGHQALWRGVPLRIFGRAVYGKPGIVSAQGLPDFFAAPDPVDQAAYRDLRRFLLATSQVPGGFYSAQGRQRLLRRIADLMLSPADPYDLAAHVSPVEHGPPRVVASA